jgi:hypothetical protein
LTAFAKSITVLSMRSLSILLLIVFAVTLVTPLSSFSLDRTGKDCDMLSTLDVCNSAAPALSSNGEMPCVHMTANGIIHVVFVTFHETTCPVFTELILTTRNEQPPQS